MNDPVRMSVSAVVCVCVCGCCVLCSVWPMANKKDCLTETENASILSPLPATQHQEKHAHTLFYSLTLTLAHLSHLFPQTESHICTVFAAVVVVFQRQASKEVVSGWLAKRRKEKKRKPELIFFLSLSLFFCKNKQAHEFCCR